jgi:hypothetical protein
LWLVVSLPPDFLIPLFHICSFTGGDTGISIARKAGMVPMQMELGGKDACIVLEDADLDLVAANIIKGGFSYRQVRRHWSPSHGFCKNTGMNSS